MRYAQFNFVSKAIFIALLLSGCASYRGINPTLQMKSASSYESETSLPNQGGTWPKQNWVKEFGGAPLEELVAQAYAQNPGIQVAFARLEQAQAMTNLRQANRLPGIGVGVATSSFHTLDDAPLAKQISGETFAAAGLTFSYDFDFWGRLKFQYKAALSQKKSLEAQDEQARLMLACAVTESWLKLALAGAQEDTSKKLVKELDKKKQLTNLRRQAGLGTDLDVAHVSAHLNEMRAQVSYWQEQVALIRNQLAALLGQGPDRGLKIPIPNFPHTDQFSLPNNLPLELVARRPDIVASRWMVQGADDGINAVKAAFYPNVNLMAFAGLANFGLHNLIGQNSFSSAAGPVLTLPLFNSGRLRGQLKRQNSQYDEAVANYNQTLTEALHEVADRVQSMRANQEQITNLQASLKDVEKCLVIAKQSYKEGFVNLLVVYQAQVEYLNAKKHILDAKARQLLLEVGLIKALGGGFDAHEKNH